MILFKKTVFKNELGNIIEFSGFNSNIFISSERESSEYISGFLSNTKRGIT